MSKKFSRKKTAPSKSLNRKERRKEERKLKKARKDAYSHRDYVEDNRVLGLKLAIEKDEKELKQLEKNLNFRKKKGKTNLPLSFVNDGLDYILDATDSEKIKTFEDLGPGYTREDDEDSELETDVERLPGADEESDTEFSDNDTAVKEYDAAAKASKSILKAVKASKKSVLFAKEKGADNNSDDEDLEWGAENDENEDMELSNDEDDNYSENSDTSSAKSDACDATLGSLGSLKRNRDEMEEADLKEDIYGRLRDAQGNIVPANKTGTYIPPAKRALMAGGQNEALRKKLKGLVNKISEGTIQALSSMIESLYLDNSRADVNETLTNLIMEALVTPVMSPERLAAEMVLMVAILHGNVGSEVGAFFLQEMVKKLDQLLMEPEYGSGKTMENLLLIISNIYNFKMVHSRIIFDIIDKFVTSFGERDIELLLLMLKTVGFSLRRDDPVRLKQAILDIQTKARTVENSSGEVLQSRVRFMLDVLMAVRNNNMRKIPSYDPTHIEHLKKVSKNFIRGQGLGDDQLNISLEDILRADQVGRWWIVGSAWEGRNNQADSAKEAKSRTEASVVGNMSSQMLKLAKKQGMNTDVRRHIFFILGSSEDFEDAFARLLRLGLNHTQEREIIHVILHCCLNEADYNPFYAYLAHKFCSFDRRFMMTVQFSMWDKFKEMEKTDKGMRSKLAKFLSHLLLSKSLSLSIFKVVEFGMEGKKMIRFLTQVLTDVTMSSQTSSLVEMFERIAPFPKLKALRQGLQVFMRIHLKGTKQQDSLSKQDLQQRLEMAESAMFSSQASSML